nr:hypothetical protein [Tanacetum cinerariifolium]
MKCATVKENASVLLNKDGLDASETTKTGSSFAILLCPKVVYNKVHFRTLVNEEKVDTFDCVLPKAAAAKVKSKVVECFGSCLLRDWIELDCYSNWYPIMLDVFTSSMCVESWGRISFARALIEISAHSSLKKEVTMAIKEVIRVEEDIPKTSSMAAKSSTMKENEKGFVEVKSRKKKRGVDSRSFHGLWLPKPNSKVIWQQKRSVGSKGGSNNASPSDSTNENSGKSSSSSDRPVSDTPISNSFDALNVVGEAACDSSVQDPKAKENAKGKCSNLEDLERESDEDEVYFPNEDCTSGLGGGFSLEEDDSDCYDGYETQIYNIPGYDIRLNSRRRK